jgi:hypothetical protein
LQFANASVWKKLTAGAHMILFFVQAFTKLSTKSLANVEQNVTKSELKTRLVTRFCNSAIVKIRRRKIAVEIKEHLINH